MTFLQAALEILKNEPDGLHFSEIARRAVARKLLVHVGRDPEAAMRAALTSAARVVDGGLIERTKPGVYRVRPGAARAADPEPATPAVAPVDAPVPAAPTEATAGPAPKPRRSRGRAEPADDAPGPAPAREDPPQSISSSSMIASIIAESAEKLSKLSVPAPTGPVELSFEAPEGSEEGTVSDVALVMAHAMSRLTERRPDLRAELLAQQSIREAADGGGHEFRSRSALTRPAVREVRPLRALESRVERAADSPAGEDDERAGRRRRRRRKRVRRADDGAREQVPAAADLLARAHAILEQSGGKSMHARQISEQLAQQGLLGGEISEIERALTAAILLDHHRQGDLGRFSVRGESRYQARAARLSAGVMERLEGLRGHRLELDEAVRHDLEGWIRGLGARALETLCRIWAVDHGVHVLHSIAPARGLARLVLEDPEADVDDPERAILLLIVPAKGSIERAGLETEAERHRCGALWVVATGQGPVELPEPIRVIRAGALADWMLRSGIGTRSVPLAVRLPDLAALESIAGLDS